MRASPTVDAVMCAQRAASFKTRSIKTSAKIAGLKLALSMLDLTTLEGKDSAGKVRSLCAKGATPDPQRDDLPGVAAICVYPAMVRTVRTTLDAMGDRGRSIKVASVATAFPSGQAPLGVKLADARAAIEDGADEIDMVIARGRFLAGEHDAVADEIRALQQLCVTNNTHLKVILETGELETLDNVRAASDLAIRAMADAVADLRLPTAPARKGEAPDNTQHNGAVPAHPHEPEGVVGEMGRSGGRGVWGDVAGGFIKTSTGKVSPAATMPVTLVMLEAIRDHYRRTGHVVGMKPAGGIRAAKEALHYLVMVKETLGDRWLTPDLFRFGASSLANDILRQLRRHEPAEQEQDAVLPRGYSARYDVTEA